MSTLFGGSGIRGRRDIPLCEYPAWAVEIMMGLYGPDTIRAACEESARDEPARPRRPDAWVTDVAPEADDRLPSMATPQLSPYGVQLEAVNELTRFLEKKFRRR